jgi:hypothetical protein
MVGGLAVICIAAGVIAVNARIAVEIAAGLNVEIAAETMPDVGGRVHLEEGVAPEADQCQEKLSDQNGAADGSTNDEYSSHFLPPFSKSPRHGERTRLFIMG